MLLFEISGGEGGIRTLGTGVSPYNGLANRRIRPLCHLSATVLNSLPRWESLPWRHVLTLVRCMNLRGRPARVVISRLPIQRIAIRNLLNG